MWFFGNLIGIMGNGLRAQGSGLQGLGLGGLGTKDPA